MLVYNVNYLFILLKELCPVVVIHRIYTYFRKQPLWEGSGEWSMLQTTVELHSTYFSALWKSRLSMDISLPLKHTICIY